MNIVNKDRRMTKQRQVILERLREVKTHPTTDEVYAMVKEDLPKISLGTVYRNLDILAELGLIQKLEMAGQPKRFDGNPHPHLHGKCIACERVVDLGPDFDFGLDKKINGFKVLDYKLEIIGLCSRCQEKENKLK